MDAISVIIIITIIIIHKAKLGRGFKEEMEK
jgi:hypothetical protein